MVVFLAALRDLRLRLGAAFLADLRRERLRFGAAFLARRLLGAMLTNFCKDNHEKMKSIQTHKNLRHDTPTPIADVRALQNEQAKNKSIEPPVENSDEMAIYELINPAAI